jgi:response regulator of citrate/malate metabolism
LSLLSQRAGLSTATLMRLRDMLAEQDEPTVTTRSVAAALSVQQRTARRLLNRLERAGAAQSTGRQGLEGSGRPLVTYELYL